MEHKVEFRFAYRRCMPVLRKIRYKLKRVLFKLSPRLAETMGVAFPFHSLDRHFLEKDIFGYVNKRFGSAGKHHRLLFVGLDKHNWHYHRLLDLQFHTIDIDARNARYGQPGLHRTGSATELAECYDSNFFDVVIANGMVGFGINTLNDFNAMMRGIAEVTKPGGLVVLGYSNLPDRVKFAPADAPALEAFTEEVPDIPLMASSVHTVNNEFQHAYWFLRRV